MLRKTLFWIHLAAGLLAGVVILVKCGTGALLTLEKPTVAWIDRDVRRATPPTADAPRLSLAELTQRLRIARPEARPTAITVEADPAAAVVFRLGREEFVYANPYTGEIHAPPSANAQRNFRRLLDWHRWFGLEGATRSIGKHVGGAANIVFGFLALSGLYLWWPRHWSGRGLRAIAVLNLRLAGRARELNWHQAIGLWCAPVLLVITVTALPLAYHWAGDLIPRLTGEAAEGTRAAEGGSREPENGARRERERERETLRRETPPRAAREDRLPREGERRDPAGTKASAEEKTTPQPDRLLALAAAAVPGWENITLRLGGGGSRDGANGGGGGRNGGNASGASAVVRQAGVWPRTATLTLHFDRQGGAISGREDFAQQTLARRIRGWMRFLHTGEALGWAGQLAAGVACLGGLFLVYTGGALSWRRFFGRKAAVPERRAAADFPGGSAERDAG